MNTISSQDLLQPKSLASSSPINFSQLVGEYFVHFTFPGTSDSVTLKMSTWKSDAVAKISTVVPQVNTYLLVSTCSTNDVLLIEVQSFANTSEFFTSKFISIFLNSIRFLGSPHSCFANALKRQLPSGNTLSIVLSFSVRNCLMSSCPFSFTFSCVRLVVGIGMSGSFVAAVPGRAMNVGLGLQYPYV